VQEKSSYSQIIENKDDGFNKNINSLLSIDPKEDKKFQSSFFDNSNVPIKPKQIET